MESLRVILSLIIALLLGEGIVETETVNGEGSGEALEPLRIVSIGPNNVTIQLDLDESSSSYTILYHITSMPNQTTEVTVNSSVSEYTATGLLPRTNYTFMVSGSNTSSMELMPYSEVTALTSMPEGVGFLLNGVLHGSNSIVALDKIGEDSAALFCLTNKTDCCSRLENRDRGIGEWFFPTRSKVNTDDSGDDIYRTRGPSVVGLNRRNNAQTTGVFRCEIEDASSTKQNLYIGVYKNPLISTIPSAGISHNGVLYANNSIVILDEIGEGSAALICLTNNRQCCTSSDTLEGEGIGEWFFPNGSKVNRDNYGDSVYRTRGLSVVGLNRRNNAQVPGEYLCEIPDVNGVTQRLFISIYPGPNISYFISENMMLVLTCTFTNGIPTWMRNGVTLNNNDQDIQISNSNASSNLTVSDNNAGNYTCIVEIGEGSLVTSIVINGTGRTVTTAVPPVATTRPQMSLTDTQATVKLPMTDSQIIFTTTFTKITTMTMAPPHMTTVQPHVTVTVTEQSLPNTAHPLSTIQPLFTIMSQPLSISEPQSSITGLPVSISKPLPSTSEILLSTLEPLSISEPQSSITGLSLSTSKPLPSTSKILLSTLEPLSSTTRQPVSTSIPLLSTSEILLSTSIPLLSTSEIVLSTSEIVLSTSEPLSPFIEQPQPTTPTKQSLLSPKQPIMTTTPENMLPSNTSQPPVVDKGNTGLSPIVGGASGAFFLIALIIVILVIVGIILSVKRRGKKLTRMARHNTYGMFNELNHVLDDNYTDSAEARLELKSVEKTESGEENVKKKPAEKKQYENVGAKYESVSSIVSDQMKPVPITEFSNYVEKMHSNKNKLFEYEYSSLSTIPFASLDIALLPYNKLRNRFANIHPYDFSRVVLEEIPGENGSDYINASYIDGYKKPKAYIAAQGPMPNTLTDFWRMIWEYKLSTVVMLTRCFEGRKKCEEYWPKKIGQSINFDDKFTITLKSHLPFAEYIIRSMSIKCTSEPNVPALEVTQFHFVGWPDHGVPNNAIVLINFIRRVRKTHPFSDERHLLVHCSAGVGRTGTFIILDTMLERMKVEDTVNIYESVRELRTQRVWMVQAQAQYIFIHDALKELIICGNTEIGAASMRYVIRRLGKEDEESGKTEFETQFQNLEKVAYKVSDADYSTANEECNISKNRYQNKIPNDFARVRLRTTGVPGSDYINASFIDGYRKRGAYIATQGPLESTVNDFWRMITEYKSHCIVMLCDLQEDGQESSYCYWPTVEDSRETFGKAVVTLLSEERHPGYIVRKFTVEEKHQSALASSLASPLSVTQFHFLRWRENSPPDVSSSLLELMENVNKVQMNSGNKAITVMCNDGVGRSGTFICIHSQLERLKTEGVVDFFQAIKSARIQRVGLVPEVAQYMLCHDLVAAYLDKFDTYANFKHL